MSKDKNALEIGKVLDFNFQNIEGEFVQLSSIKGPKVISTYPKLNTRICDLQTIEMAKMSNEFENVTFVSLSNDGIEVAKEWCNAHGNGKSIVASDKVKRQFASKTNFYVKGIRVLQRGIIVVDENSTIIKTFLCADYKETPDFEGLRTFLKTI